MRTISICFALFMILLFVTSCDKKSDNITQPEEFSGNLSGTWIAEETINGNNPLGNYPRQILEIFKISQSGNSFKIIINDTDTSMGEITGNTIKWKGTRLNNNNSLTIDFTGQISSDGKTFSGTGTWTLKSGNNSESGTMSISAWKNKNRKMHLSGKWEGTYTSFNNNGNGTFTVSLLQSDSILTGTINIPSINMTDQEISGMVIDNCWSFGDINNQIKFIGIMENDSLHFKGSYSYSGYNDDGKWNAVKTSDSTAKMLLVINSFPVSADYSSDLAYDGNYLWVVNDKKLCKYSKDGNLIDSIYTPGNYPVGLSYDGNNLISPDGAWGSNKIYFLSPGGNNVLKTPAGYLAGLVFIGNDIWYLDQNNGKIIKSSRSGQILQEISINLSQASTPSGLVYAENHLWYSVFDQSKGKIRIDKMDFNGNVISSFITEGFFNGGLSFDGTHLLFVSSSEDKVFKYNLDGTLSSGHDLQLQRPSQITYDGSSIWVLAGKEDFTWGSNFYKLNSSYQVIDSLALPGQDPSCITFANNYFWFISQSSGKTIRVNPGRGDYFANPVQNLNYICYSNNQMWATDEFQEMIYNFSSTGQNLSSFSSPVQHAKGITIDGDILWLIYLNSNYKTALVKTSLSGQKLEEITTSFYDPTGLVYDGEFFWAIGQKTSFETQKYIFKMKIH